MNIEELKQKLGTADLHIHSNFSDARPSIEQILNYVENKTRLSVIAITDHDRIDGALYARELAKKKKLRFDVVVGEEVSCKEGHVIGLFLKKVVKGGTSAHQAIKSIVKQGGLVLMPHPLRHIRMNLGKNINVDGVGLITLLKEKKNVHALETINGTPTNTKDNMRATFFNDTVMMKAEVGSSDAHILAAIGMGFTLFEGHSAKELKEAILNCQTRAAHKKWKLLGMLNYLFFFLPSGFRLSINTLIHGRKPKRVQLINSPKITLNTLGKDFKSFLAQINWFDKIEHDKRKSE